MIALANDVFGFNGWSTSIISLTTDFVCPRRVSLMRGACLTDPQMDVKEDGRVSVSVGAIIRIT